MFRKKMRKQGAKRKAADAVVLPSSSDKPAEEASSRYIPDFSKKRKSFPPKVEKTDIAENGPIIPTNNTHGNTTDAVFSSSELNEKINSPDKKKMALQQQNVKDNGIKILPPRAVSVEYSGNICKETENTEAVTKASQKRKFTGTKGPAEKSHEGSCSSKPSRHFIDNDTNDIIQSKKGNAVTAELPSTSRYQKKKKIACHSDQNKYEFQTNIAKKTSLLPAKFKFIPEEKRSNKALEMDDNIIEKEVKGDIGKQFKEDIVEKEIKKNSFEKEEKEIQEDIEKKVKEYIFEQVVQKDIEKEVKEDIIGKQLKENNFGKAVKENNFGKAVKENIFEKEVQEDIEKVVKEFNQKVTKEDIEKEVKSVECRNLNINAREVYDVRYLDNDKKDEVVQNDLTSIKKTDENTEKNINEMSAIESISKLTKKCLPPAEFSSNVICQRSQYFSCTLIPTKETEFSHLVSSNEEKFEENEEEIMSVSQGFDGTESTKHKKLLHLQDEHTKRQLCDKSKLEKNDQLSVSDEQITFNMCQINNGDTVTANEVYLHIGEIITNEVRMHKSEQLQKDNGNLENISSKVKDVSHIDERCLNTEEKEINESFRPCELNVTGITEVIKRSPKINTSDQIKRITDEAILLARRNENVRSSHLVEGENISEMEPDKAFDKSISSETCVVHPHTNCCMPSFKEQSLSKFENGDNFSEHGNFSIGNEKTHFQTAEYNEPQHHQGQNRMVSVKQSDANELQMVELPSPDISNHLNAQWQNSHVTEIHDVDVFTSHKEHRNHDRSPHVCSAQTGGESEKCDSKSYNSVDETFPVSNSDISLPPKGADISVVENFQETLTLGYTEDLKGNANTATTFRELWIAHLDNTSHVTSNVADKEDLVFRKPFATENVFHDTENESNNLQRSNAIQKTEVVAKKEVSFGDASPKSEQQTIHVAENDIGSVLLNDCSDHILPDIGCKQEQNNARCLKEADERLSEAEYVDGKQQSTHIQNLNASEYFEKSENKNLSEQETEKAVPAYSFEKETLGTQRCALEEPQNVSSQTYFSTSEVQKFCIVQDDLEKKNSATEITGNLEILDNAENYCNFSVDTIIHQPLHPVRKSGEACASDDLMRENGNIISPDGGKREHESDYTPLLAETNCVSKIRGTAAIENILGEIQPTSTGKNKIITCSPLKEGENNDIDKPFEHATNFKEIPEDQSDGSTGTIDNFAINMVKKQPAIKDLQEKTMLTQKWNKDLNLSEETYDGNTTDTRNSIPLVARNTVENPATVSENAFFDHSYHRGIQSYFVMNANISQTPSKFKDESSPAVEVDKMSYNDEKCYALGSTQQTLTYISGGITEKLRTPCKTENVMNASTSDSDLLQFKNSEKITHTKNTDVSNARNSEDTTKLHNDRVSNEIYTSGSSDDWQILLSDIGYRPDSENHSSTEKEENEPDSDIDEEELFADSETDYQMNTTISITVSVAKQDYKPDEECNCLNSELKEKSESQNKTVFDADGDTTNTNIFHWDSVRNKHHTVVEQNLTVGATGNVDELTNAFKEVSPKALSNPGGSLNCDSSNGAENEVDDKGLKKNVSHNPDFCDTEKSDATPTYNSSEEEFDDDFELTASQLSQLDADVLKETTSPSDSNMNNAEAKDASSLSIKNFESSTIALEILNRLRNIDDKITGLNENMQILQHQITDGQKTGNNPEPWGSFSRF